MEVIAERKASAILGFVWVIVLALICSILGLVMYMRYGFLYGSSIVLLALSCLLFLVGVIGIIAYFSTPKVILTYSDGMFHFRNFSCRPDEIKDVDMKFVRSRGIIHGSGRIIIYFKDKKVAYSFVDNVINVHNRIFQIVSKYNEINKQG
jgi:hypothetical protein